MANQMTKSRIRLYLLVSITMGAAGCSNIPIQTTQPAQPQPIQSQPAQTQPAQPIQPIQPIQPAQPAQPAQRSAVSVQLLTQAETLQQSGNLSGAIAQVERAVRIEPRNAYAWYRLATLQLAAGDLNRAEQFARRSNQYAAGNRELIEANQKVMDEVRRLR